MNKNIFKNNFFNRFPSYSKLLLVFFMFILFFYSYSYIFSHKNNKFEQEISVKLVADTTHRINNNYFVHISFWKYEFSKLIEHMKLNQLNSKIIFLEKNKKYITTLNCVGGKIDNCILKEYNKDVYFIFSNKDIGGLLSVKSKNTDFKLNFFDRYILKEKHPGLFLFTRALSANFYFCKIFKFSTNDKIINITLKFINTGIDSYCVNIDILLSLVNHQKVSENHFERAWDKTSNIVIKHNDRIKALDINKQISYFKQLLINNISYIAINHRYFIIALSLENKNIIE